MSRRATRKAYLALAGGSGALCLAWVGLFVWDVIAPPGQGVLETWIPVVLSIVFGTTCVLSIIAVRMLPPVSTT